MLGKAVVVGSVFGLSTVGLYKLMTARVFNRHDQVYEPPVTSIVMCSLNEEFFIEKALQSLEDQNVRSKFPDKFECILMDSYSEDATVKIAEEYGWKTYEVPRGKLSARDLGIKKARGEVVVSVDCDTLYGCNYLNLMLQWFRQPNVIGVVAPRLVDPEENLLATYLSVWMSLADVGPLLAGGMRAPGQSVAFFREAYFQTGGWDLSINQQNVHEMVREEEIRFAMKLRRLGRVPVSWMSPCFTSLRRVMSVGKDDKYKKWTTERLRGERF